MDQLRVALLALAVLAVPAGQGIAQTSAAGNQSTFVNQGVVGILGSSLTGTGMVFIDEMADVVNDDVDYTLRVLPIVGKGSLRNIEDLLYLKGIDATIVQADVLDFYLQQGDSTVQKKIRYITKLYDEEMHVLVGPGIQSIWDLDQRKVNLGQRSGGTFMSAGVIIDKLGIAPEVQAFQHKIALKKLVNGEIDAMLWMGGSPIPDLAKLPADGGFQLLELPHDLANGTSFGRTQLTSEDYPNLIPPGKILPTLESATILAAYDWPKANPRRHKVERFVEAFRSHFAELQQEPYHEKWRTVDWSEEVPGWQRWQ